MRVRQLTGWPCERVKRVLFLRRRTYRWESVNVMTIDTLAKNWWALAIRGGFAILFGILAVVWPDLTVGALVFLFGAYALVDGVFAILAAIRAMESKRSWVGLLIEGVLGILVGILTFV